MAARSAWVKSRSAARSRRSTKLVTYEIHPKRIIQRSLHMIVADGVTKADGVTIYTAKDLKVGLFSPEQLEAQMK